MRSEICGVRSALVRLRDARLRRFIMEKGPGIAVRGLAFESFTHGASVLPIRYPD